MPFDAGGDDTPNMRAASRFERAGCELDAATLAEDDTGERMFEKILVALDGSPRAPDVLTTARAVAGRFSATLYPLRVVTYPPDLSPARTEAVTQEAKAELLAVFCPAGSN